MCSVELGADVCGDVHGTCRQVAEAAIAHVYGCLHEGLVRQIERDWQEAIDPRLLLCIEGGEQGLSLLVRGRPEDVYDLHHRCTKSVHVCGNVRVVESLDSGEEVIDPRHALT